MTSEAIRKKALELCTEEHQSWHTPECGQCANIAAALDEARAEGEKAAVTTAADVFASDVAQAYERGFKAGAELERWECYCLMASPAVGMSSPPKVRTAVQALAAAIAARGPMRGPEEEAMNG